MMKGVYGVSADNMAYALLGCWRNLNPVGLIDYGEERDDLGSLTAR
jgi:hypothetical protein